MPARIGAKYANDMFALIGSKTRRGRAEMALGMGGTVSRGGRMAAIRRENMIKHGKRATGYAGSGLAGLSLLSTSRSTGNYKPAPISPISSPQGSGRYA